MLIVSTPIQPAAAPGGAGYRAGVCNIGPSEVRRRRLWGVVGVLVAVVVAGLHVVAGAPAPARLVVLFPLWGAAIGLLQAHRRFCVAYAMAGIANFGSGEATRVAVGDGAARRADRTATVRLVRDAFLSAAIVAFAFTLLPV